ncbi:hypothetical protein [Rummeliibacillus suwonensis]|jgi:hypothetical protein|uniref:hypothetical protein n=1 Tax=Rummeliibacillus suwonensis TaxID=1306154 RepID=UPI001AAEE39B|nr:hypothetical protein [Rummeliibacillus suwonensis]MBO2537204.1 hypothetical protein [Rummeliibacillus suwonensis]
MKFSTKIMYVLALFLTSVAGTYLMNFITGEVNYSVILGGLVGSLVLFIYFLINERKKESDVSFYDERSKKIITTYVAIISPILFVLISFVIIFLLFLDITTVNTETLFIFPILSLIIIGIGGLISNKVL